MREGTFLPLLLAGMGVPLAFPLLRPNEVTLVSEPGTIFPSEEDEELTESSLATALACEARLGHIAFEACNIVFSLKTGPLEVSQNF